MSVRAAFWRHPALLTPACVAHHQAGPRWVARRARLAEHHLHTALRTFTLPAAIPTSGIAFRDSPPPASLAPWVASYWTLTIAVDSPASRYWVAPDGCTHLVLHEGRAVVAGPTLAPLERTARRGASWFGVRLQPGAARAFLALAAQCTLRGTSLRLEDVPHLAHVAHWAQTLDTREPLERLVDAASAELAPLVNRAPPPDPVVAEAIRTIQANASPTIESLGARLGLSSRHFRRRFLAAVDLTPREYARLWRFRRCVLDLLAGTTSPSAAQAAARGYADQSHLIREFRRLGGMTPSAFVQRLRNVEHHGAWDPSRPEYRRP